MSAKLHESRTFPAFLFDWELSSVEEERILETASCLSMVCSFVCKHSISDDWCTLEYFLEHQLYTIRLLQLFVGCDLYDMEFQLAYCLYISLNMRVRARTRAVYA